MNFYHKVYYIVAQIPKGKVATYGQIALLAGSPRASRAVGYALHVNPKPGEIPCHRVINKAGQLTKTFAFGGMEIQRQLLLNEGVLVSLDGVVDLNIYQWKPNEIPL